MANNGGSYQKFDGASGTYQEIPNGSQSGPGAKKTKWLVAAALLVAVGVGYGAFSMHSSPQKAVDKALANTGNVQVKKNGKLKLFDSLSESPSTLLVCLLSRYRSFVCLKKIRCRFSRPVCLV